MIDFPLIDDSKPYFELTFRPNFELISIVRRFVSAFYDPSRTINRFAASNKIADALAVGRPILMNCELEIAKQLGPVGCALCVPYTKIAHLADKVVALADDRDTYNAACAKARAAYDANYAWEAVRDRMHTMLASDQVPVEQHNLSHRVESA